MIREDLVMVACCDLSGQVRGKGFPVRELEKRWTRGIGWVPTNSLITCFNSIAEGPFGSTDDLLLIPDRHAEVRVDFDDQGAIDHFILGDIKTLRGEPWNFCPRNQLRTALNDLRKESGLNLKVAYEHELWCAPEDELEWHGFGLDSFRRHVQFGEVVTAALRAAGVETDTFLAEFGANQIEVTVSPTIGIRAADECVIVRELVRAVATRMNRRVSFSPVVNDGVGNGLHIHVSLVDNSGKQAIYHAGNPLHQTNLAAQFFAGVRRYLPAILALTAASVVSYERLKPHRWSAAYNNIAIQDREAALRICPIVQLPGFEPGSQYNVEFRAADATGNPYLQLAAIARAGLQGIRDSLPAAVPTENDLSLLSPTDLADLDIERLPLDLPAALERMQRETILSTWFSSEFVELYTAHKNGEIRFLEGNDAETIRQKYAGVY